MEKVIRGCIGEMNAQASEQALPGHLSEELRKLLVGSTHRISRARDVASKYLNSLVTSFPSLMCDPPLVYAILECLTLLRHACENEFTNEVTNIAFRRSSQLTSGYSTIRCTSSTLSAPASLCS